MRLRTIILTFSLLPLLCGFGCDEEAPEAEKKSGYRNQAAYQGFFAHYPFGGHPVTTWTDRLNALAPGGAEANPKAYALALRRADQVGLKVAGEAQAHVVTIKGPLIDKLIVKVDKMNKK